MSISYISVTNKNMQKSSLVVEVNEKQGGDPIFLERKSAIHHKRVEVFSQGEECALAIRFSYLFVRLVTSDNIFLHKPINKNILLIQEPLRGIVIYENLLMEWYEKR